MTTSVLDVVSVGAQRDCIVVLPTLPHALRWWPVVIGAIKTHHREGTVHVTRTAVVCKDTKTVTRLWVPYAREPTMPMDVVRDRANRELLYLYDLARKQ